MRAMRYEVFTWADAACQAPGRPEHPLAPMLTGIRADGAWVRGEFDLAVQLAEETLNRDRPNSSVLPSGRAERTFANAPDLVGEPTRGNVEALRQVELGRRLRQTIRGWSTTCAIRQRVGHSSNGDYEQADALDCPSRSRGEAYDVTEHPGVGGGRRGFASRTEEDAPEVFSASGRIAPPAGNRWMHGSAMTEASGLLVL